MSSTTADTGPASVEKTGGPVRIAYARHGHDGEPVLMVMGYTMPGRAWASQVPTLSRRHRVVTFDNRGIGGSDEPPGPYAMSDMRDDALRLMDHLGWGRAHVVGVSMGGMIAQHIALDARDRVRTLSLIATHPGGILLRTPRTRGLRLFIKTTLGRGRGRLRSLERLLYPDEFLSNVDREWMEQALWSSLTPPPTAAARKNQLMAILGHSVSRRLPELVGLPTLVISPDRDVLVRPVACRRLASLIPDATLVRIPDAGHGVIRQSADRVNRLLLDHFASVSQSPGAPGS